MLTFRFPKDEDIDKRRNLEIETGMGSEVYVEPDPDPWPTVAKAYPPLAPSTYPSEIFDFDDNLVARFNFADSAKPDFDLRNPDSLRNSFYENLLQGA